MKLASVATLLSVLLLSSTHVIHFFACADDEAGTAVEVTLPEAMAKKVQETEPARVAGENDDVHFPKKLGPVREEAQNGLTRVRTLAEACKPERYRFCGGESVDVTPCLLAHRTEMDSETSLCRKWLTHRDACLEGCPGATTKTLAQCLRSANKEQDLNEVCRESMFYKGMMRWFKRNKGLSGEDADPDRWRLQFEKGPAMRSG